MNEYRKFISDDLNNYDLTESISGRIGYRNDRRIRKTLEVMSCNPKRAAKIRERMMRMLNKTPEFVNLACNEIPFGCPRGLLNGPIIIGYVYDPVLKIKHPFGLDLTQLNQNLLIAGRAGSGKTTLLMQILLCLIALDIPFLVIDFKRDYSSLIRYSEDIYVFNWKNFRFNPLLPPPNTDNLSWNQIFADVFFNVFFAPQAPLAAKSVLLETLCSLTEKNGVLLMRELDAELDKMTLDGRTPSGVKERIRTTQSRLKPCNRTSEAVFSDSFRIEELLAKRVVLQLDGLSVELQAFIVTILFYWIFTFRMNSCQRGKLRHCLVFDEAKMVFSSELASGSSTIARLASQSREFGEALAVADQTPSCLGNSILANLFAIISLSLSSQRDIQAMAYAMNLDEEQRKYLNNLPLKTGICKLADRYTNPFLFNVPHAVVDKSIGDGEIAAYMEPKLSSLELVYGNNGPADVKPAGSVKRESDADSGTANKPPAQDALTENETLLLNDIRNRPFIGIAQRYGDLAITNYMGNKVCRQLIEKGLVSEVRIRTSSRGRPETFYELTASGAGIAGAQNLGSGKGGLEHVFHQHRLQDFYERQGYEAVIEEFRNGKACDLGLAKDGRRIALEIAASNPSKECSNIEKDLAAGWREIWILSTTVEIMESVKSDWKAISASYPDASIEFYMLADSMFYFPGDSGKAKGGG